MNILLPDIEKLFPIYDTRKTFSETPLNKDFELLSFRDKLQVINDIVRQTMMYEPTPNPKNEVETMIGNSYTSSLISIEYLKRLNLGTNHRSVFAKKRKYDPDDITTTHILTLVDDLNGNTYQCDCSPYVGYKCGKVEMLHRERYYDEYVNIDDRVADILKNIRNYSYKVNCKHIGETEIVQFLDLLNDAKQYEILNGYTSYCYTLLLSQNDNFINRSRLLSLINERNPYSRLGGDSIKLQEKEKLILQQIMAWGEELDGLIPHDLDYQRQLELAQCIVQELKDIDTSYEKHLILNGKRIPFSYISPRLFYEHGLNVVLLKPSSFRLGVSATIRERFLHSGKGAIGEYFPNIGAPSVLTGIKPMRMFHPHGYKYERSMNGPGDLFLIQDTVDNVLKKKRQLRNELGKNLVHQEIMWYDDNNILWDPIITNLVHTTDDPSEASMHYLAAYPEHQLMTRFMYPNPRLEKVLKK